MQTSGPNASAIETGSTGHYGTISEVRSSLGETSSLARTSAQSWAH
jgi:hypothetical protein